MNITLCATYFLEIFNAVLELVDKSNYQITDLHLPVKLVTLAYGYRMTKFVMSIVRYCFYFILSKYYAAARNIAIYCGKCTKSEIM